MELRDITLGFNDYVSMISKYLKSDLEILKCINKLKAKKGIKNGKYLPLFFVFTSFSALARSFFSAATICC